MPRKSQKVKKSVRTRSGPAAAESNPLGLRVALLEETFAALAPKGPELVARFYEQLFERFPAVRPMFSKTSLAEQEKKLLDALVLVVNNLRNPDKLVPALQSLGKKHQEIGAIEAHYHAVADTLLSVMAEFAGSLWSEEVQEAWSDALNLVAKTMLEAYSSEKPAAKGTKRVRTTVASKEKTEKRSKPVEEKPNPLGLKVELLEETFALLAPKADELVARFYEELFGRYPSVKPMFSNTSMAEQHKKLIDALVMVVNNLRNPDKLVPALKSLGEKHQTYGVTDEHYGAVATTLLDVMKEFAGSKWTDDVQTAWSEALNVVASTMLDAYTDVTTLKPFEQKETAKKRNVISAKTSKPKGVKPMSDKTNPSQNLTADERKQQELLAEAARLNSAVEGSATAMMQIDRDFIITYANPATVKMVKANIEHFKATFKGFDLDNIVGSCIDIFHKNPAHQRKLLADPKNLPYQTDIQIGPLTFALNVSAMTDNTGNYIGNSLEWANVTNLRAQENEAARLTSAAEGSATAMMQIDRDFIITYANPATVEMVKANLEHFKATFNGFDLDNIVGSCIDIFHKNPAHQRKLLDDPKNLPYKTDIRIGPLTFTLNVSAMTDKAGNYIGNSLEWANVTNLRKQENDAARLSSAAEGSATAQMQIDREFIITYANPATAEMVKANLEHFKATFKGFDLDNIVGSCIDIFHKNPAHQRNLLADPKNLPYKTTIPIGPLTFALNVSAMTDKAGNYIGNSLEWSNVTELQAQERNAARLQSAIEGSATAMMMVDRDFIITYANPATVKMVQENLNVFKSAFNGFDLDKLIGTCIDIFHAKPEHQRKLLDDPRNLPYATNIRVGELTFSLNVSAMRDASENYIGNTLEWANVTDKVTVKDATGDAASRLDSAASELVAVANQMAGNAEETSTQANNVSSASEQVSRNIGGVATAIEEMNTTIKEVADRAAEAAKVADNAVELAGEANTIISNLGDSSQDISKVIKVITSIAEQTNLLALNATIEAARAGEAGKGFAVVANEVKELAKETAKATEDITQKIEQIQTDSGNSVDSIKSVADIINKINEIANTIASAVEEQATTATDIARSVAEAATGADSIVENIAQVSQAAGDTSKGAATSKDHADGLTELSKEMAELVTKMKI